MSAKMKNMIGERWTWDSTKKKSDSKDTSSSSYLHSYLFLQENTYYMYISTTRGVDKPMWLIKKNLPKKFPFNQGILFLQISLLTIPCVSQGGGVSLRLTAVCLSIHWSKVHHLNTFSFIKSQRSKVT